MLKTILVAAFAVLLNGCPFLPPSPYHRTLLGDLPPGYIAMLPGQSVEESATWDLPGHVDIIGASSELDGEVLTATFRLRDLPEEPELVQGIGHFRDEAYRWAVLISIGGDPLTPLNHPDYRFQATYYDPEVQRFALNRIVPAEPYITTSIFKVGRATTTCDYLEEEVEVAFSHEDGTLTLAARIPGITDTSTIAFLAHNFLTFSPDYAPRDAD